MSENQDKKSNWKDREMGALWKKKGNSQTYLSGTIEIPSDEYGGKEKVNVVIYSNKYKEKDNHPDFRVYRSEEMKKEATVQEDSDNEILD
jgi:uncharacterized protein (DUF736 family)